MRSDVKPITRPGRTSLPRRPVAPASAGGAPRVSVVLPTRDRADLVGRAISSVLSQTFRDFELIVVDDGSKDRTKSAGFVSDPRMRVVRLAISKGVSRARNAGIASARGEWVAFLDDDDEWLPRMLELQLSRIDRNTDPRTSAVYCLAASQTPDGLQPSPYAPPLPEGDVLDSLLANGHTISPCAHMVKRSALFEVGGFDETFWATGDRDLWLRLAQASHHVVAVPETLLIVHGGHKRRLTEDGVAMSRGFAAYDRRWANLARRRLGLAVYTEAEVGRRRWLKRLHRRHVNRLVRRGSRARAWRYVRAMTPTLRTFPWGTRFVAGALAVVVFGRSAARLPLLPGRSTEINAYRALGAGSTGDDAT